LKLERLNSFILADTEKCVGCRTCEIACVLAHMAVPPEVAGEVNARLTPRLFVVSAGEVTAPVMCRHCEDAPCANVCKMSAISRADGRVLLDTERCVGCHLCLMACPFGAIEFAPLSRDGVLIYQAAAKSSGAKNRTAIYRATKCDLCSDRIDGPACASNCPEKALVLVNAAAATQRRRNEAALDLLTEQNAVWL
jgi:electron transport protein HydN